MGLDMYLRKEIYIGANYNHTNINGIIDLKKGTEEIKIDLKQLVSVTEYVANWHNLHSIHEWFVDNIQYGDDDCRKYDVSYEELQELANICKIILEQNTKEEKLSKAKELLPSDYENYDERYLDELKEVQKILQNLDPQSEYSYDSSW